MEKTTIINFPVFGSNLICIIATVIPSSSPPPVPPPVPKQSPWAMPCAPHNSEKVQPVQIPCITALIGWNFLSTRQKQYQDLVETRHQYGIWRSILRRRFARAQVATS